jgi:hypothetical protein
VQIVQGSQLFSFSYGAIDQSNDLAVGFLVYKITGDVPVLQGTIEGQPTANGVYVGGWIGDSGETYLVIGAVYEDGPPYEVPDLNYAPTAETFQCTTDAVLTLGFNYAAFDQNAGLFVGATVYDFTTGAPVELDFIQLEYLTLGVYWAKFTGTLGHTYLISSAVYTDGSYSSVNTYRATGTENFDCIEIGNITIINNTFESATLEGQDAEATLVGQSSEAILEGSCD